MKAESGTGKYLGTAPADAISGDLLPRSAVYVSSAFRIPRYM